MTRKSNTISALVLLAAAAAGASAIVLQQDASSAQTASPKAAETQWTASAPGRIEPRGGEVRISALTPGRIVEIAVAANDQVRAGDLLIRLDDEDAATRVAAAEAEAAVRKRERDTETNVPRLAFDRRQAEDTVATSERAMANARIDLDRIMRQHRAREQGLTEETVASARRALAAAKEKLESDRAALRRAQRVANAPLPTRLEAGLTAARTDLWLAEAALERTRVRAPIDGTVLQLVPRIGETAAASPEQTLAVIGDLGGLRVRAELDERDVPKVKSGHTVVVRLDAYQGREFSGKVASIARTLSPPKLAQRGPRRPNDLDSLEIMIDLDPAPELLPGMRVDVFFKADEPPKAETVAPARAEGGGPAPAAAATPASAPAPAQSK